MLCMHFDYGSLLKTILPILQVDLESVLNFGALQFYLYNMDRQSQMVYLLQVLCPILNYVGARACLFWLTCQPLLLETMVQDIETYMKVSVHAKLQEA